MGMLSRRLSAARGEAGMTLIELLVASAMGVVLLGAVGTMMVGSLRQQPQVTRKVADVQTARWVMERFTRELRAGVVIDKASASSVSFKTYVRRSTCGGTSAPSSSSPSIKCEVTYTCSGSTCTRLEAAPGVYTGTATTLFTGLNNSSSVFTYTPATTPTYVGISITIPVSGSNASTTLTDGASLRNATLSN
jgi:Tfp pilus assembly protein PilW